jgi:coenzyme F420-reducing hydrogenase beta subunit
MAARHTAATNANELAAMQGSKYVQSDTGKTFIQAKEYLDQGRYVLYTGTPCQIAGLQSFLGREYKNLLTVDLICHGVPSPRLFAQHIAWLEKKKRIKLEEYAFRSKERQGWGLDFRCRYIDMKRQVSGEFCGRPDEDPYYHAFLAGASYRECCYACKYATASREGDFTIGDYRGVEEIHPEIPAKDGVSLVIANTTKAAEILKELGMLDHKVSLLTHAIQFQHNLKAPSPRPKERDLLKTVDQKSYSRYARRYSHSRAFIIARLKALIPQGMKGAIKRFANTQAVIKKRFGMPLQ